MAKKPDARRKIPVRMDLLNVDEKKALREEARKSVLAEMEQDARDAYFQQALTEVRRENVPEDQIVHVAIDLAPFLNNIMINEVQYFHGYSYPVPQKLAIVLYEQMQRSWQHEDETSGRSKFSNTRRPRNRVLGPRDMGTVTRGVNGPITAEL